MGEKSSYTIDDFKIIKDEIKSNISMIKLELPQKNMSMTSCYRVYLYLIIHLN
ncbi:MAG: hypothetical protein RSG52_11945 [Terrisporobacter sp.]|uniref:hypothetical protein n=1 Tax=Terrisporobacter sp. TaxID=1965305 RepID=UPI002FC62744